MAPPFFVVRLFFCALRVRGAVLWIFRLGNDGKQLRRRAVQSPAKHFNGLVPDRPGLVSEQPVKGAVIHAGTDEQPVF